MWPEAEVKTWHLGPSCRDSPETIAAQIAGYDLVVSQVNSPDPAAPLALQRLREAASRAVYLPTFVFNGFHPDIIYLKTDGALVVGPLQQLHSAIIAGCYVLGVPEARTARLFNALTYASLGYFDAFAIARDMLAKNFAATGYDIGPVFEGSAAGSGPFMHTLNHPRIVVLSTLAHMAAVRAGLADAADSAPQHVEDFLAHSIQWPVYPELARKLSLPESNLVVKLSSRTLDRAPAQLRKLPELVAEFYATYARQERSALRSAMPPRIVAGLEKLLEA